MDEHLRWDEISGEVMQWHQSNGGSMLRPAGHALRLLREAVELCIASGAAIEEIEDATKSEINRGLEKGEFVGVINHIGMTEELADVTILQMVFAKYLKINLALAIPMKLRILHHRTWTSDKDGVLWRPGRTKV